MELQFQSKPRKVKADKLIASLRRCAQRISDSVSEKDSEWEEIGLMRDAANAIEQLTK